MKYKEIARRSIIILPLFLPFFIIRFSIANIPTTLLEVMIWAIFFSNLVLSNIKIKWSWHLIVAIAFLISGLISALIDPDITAGLGLYKAYFIDGFLVYLLVANLSDAERKVFSNFLIFSGIISSLGALSLYFNGIRSEDGRIIDLSLLNPNYLAMFLAPIIVLTVASITNKISRKTIFLIAALILLLATAYLTKSRGVIISVVPALIYLFYSLNKKKTTLKKIGAWLLIIGFFVGGYLYFKPDWSDHARKATSSNVRYYIWSTSVEMIEKNPILGVGLSNYQDYFSSLTKDRVNYPEFISPQALTAHNIFLQLYLTTGLLGLLSFMGLILFALYRARNKAFSAILIAILSYGLVDTPFFRNDLSILFWMVLALCYENSD